MSDSEHNPESPSADGRKPSLREKIGKKLGISGRTLFIVWILYQSVKGITTLSLIWIPLIYWYWTH